MHLLFCYKDLKEPLNSKIYCSIVLLFFSLVDFLVEEDRGGREPGRIGAGGGREAGGDGAGCGSHVRAGGGRTMRDIKFFNDFLVPF